MHTHGGDAAGDSDGRAVASGWPAERLSQSA